MTKHGSESLSQKGEERVRLQIPAVQKLLECFLKPEQCSDPRLLEQLREEKLVLWDAIEQGTFGDKSACDFKEEFPNATLRDKLSILKAYVEGIVLHAFDVPDITADLRTMRETRLAAHRGFWERFLPSTEQVGFFLQALEEIQILHWMEAQIVREKEKGEVLREISSWLAQRYRTLLQRALSMTMDEHAPLPHTLRRMREIQEAALQERLERFLEGEKLSKPRFTEWLLREKTAIGCLIEQDIFGGKRGPDFSQAFMTLADKLDILKAYLEGTSLESFNAPLRMTALQTYRETRLSERVTAWKIFCFWPTYQRQEVSPLLRALDEIQILHWMEEQIVVGGNEERFQEIHGWLHRRRYSLVRRDLSPTLETDTPVPFTLQRMSEIQGTALQKILERFFKKEKITDQRLPQWFLRERAALFHLIKENVFGDKSACDFADRFPNATLADKLDILKAYLQGTTLANFDVPHVTASLKPYQETSLSERLDLWQAFFGDAPSPEEGRSLLQTLDEIHILHWMEQQIVEADKAILFQEIHAWLHERRHALVSGYFPEPSLTQNGFDNEGHFVSNTSRNRSLLLSKDTHTLLLDLVGYDQRRRAESMRRNTRSLAAHRSEHSCPLGSAPCACKHRK